MTTFGSIYVHGMSPWVEYLSTHQHNHFFTTPFQTGNFSALFRSPRWHGSWTHNECGSCEFELHTGYWSCLEIGIFCSNSMVRNFRHSLPQRSGTSWNFSWIKVQSVPSSAWLDQTYWCTVSHYLWVWGNIIFSNTWRLGRI